MAALQRAQATALAAGDPAAVIAATRPLITQVFLDLAKANLLEGHRADAKQLLNSAAQNEPDAAQRLSITALLLRSGNPAEAAQQARLVTQVNPTNPSAWVLEGMASRKQGDLRAAADSFTQALKLRSDINVAYALGSVLLQLHDDVRAQQIFAEINQASHNAAVWHVAEGDAFRQAKLYDQATAELKQALTLDPTAAHAEFFLGLTYLQNNEWAPSPESLEHLRKAVAQHPQEYVSNFYLGAAESTLGTDLAGSDRHLQVAAKANTAQPEVWLYLGLNANREHDTAAAERYLRKAIALTGDDDARNNYQIRRAYFTLGRLLVAQGKHEEAAALLERYRKDEQASVALSGDEIARVQGNAAAGGMVPSPSLLASLPTPAADSPAPAVLDSLPAAEQTAVRAQAAALRQLLGSAWNDLGVAQARQGQYPIALASFQKAEHWQQTPDATLLRNLGAAAFRCEDFPEASRALSAYFAKLQTQPTTATPQTQAARQHAELMLGYAEAQQHHFPQAVAAFDAAPQATMADPRVAATWAEALVRTSHAERANKIADTLTAQPQPNDVLPLLCHIYVEAENYEGSLACYRKAYGQDPTLPLAHYEAGEALVRLDRPQEALAELEQEQKLSPGNPNVDYSVAYAMLQSSHKPEAQALLTHLTAAHPEQAEAQYQLGKLLLEEGKLPEAIAHLEVSEAENNAPDYVHYQLGSAYRKANRPADASREFKLYQSIKDQHRNSNAVSTPEQSSVAH